MIATVFKDPAMHLIAIALFPMMADAMQCGTIVPQHPPPPAVCGFPEGMITKPAILKKVPNAVSQFGNACFNACFATTGCESVSFVLDSQTSEATGCILYSKQIRHMGFNQTTSGPRSYYDRICNVCDTCSPTKDAPKIVDGTFDASTSSIAPWIFNSTGIPYQLVPSEAGDGNAFSVSLASPSGAEAVANITQQIPICAPNGNTFTFSFIYKFAVLDENTNSFIQTHFNGYQDFLAPNSTDWQAFSIQRQFSPSFPQVDIDFLNYAAYTQTYYIDNVKFSVEKS